MKLKRILMIVMCTALLLGGCSSKQVSSIQISYVNLNVKAEGEYTFWFYLSCFDSKEDYPAELIAVDGTNTDKIEFSMKEITPAFIQNPTVENGYFHYYIVECTSNEDQVSISKLVLKIEDETIEVEAPERISVIRSIPEEGHCFGLMAYPAGIFTKSLELEQVYTYSMFTNEEITLTSVSFSGGLTLKNAMLSKNGTNLGTLEQNLPLTMKPGEKYALKTAFDFDETIAGQATYYDTFSTTIIFEYAKNNDMSNILHYTLDLTSEGLMNEESLNEYIETVIGG